MTNRPWPIIADHLRAKYNILAEIDLLALDSTPHKIYDILKSVYKDTYHPNDRILIYHYDTDFYYTNLSAGFTVYNLLNCLKSLDIPVCFCIMLTNHYGITKEINQLSTDVIKMSIFESNYQLLQTTPKVNKISVNIEKIKKAFINLNGVSRPHRVFFLSYLKEYNLLDQGILSWHFDSKFNPSQHVDTKSKVSSINNRSDPSQHVDTKSKVSSINNRSDPSSCPVTFVMSVPFSRSNSDIKWNAESNKIFNKHYQTFNINWRDPSITSGSNQNRFNLPVVQDAFLYVSVETMFEYPYPYLTEKTFRAILHKRPFVIVGPTGSIAQLRSLGFKTFSNFWSEEYDGLSNPSERMQAVAKIVKDISSLSVDQLQKLMYSMQDIVEFNYDFYVNEFSTKILQHRLQSL